MATTSLMAHCGARIVERAELDKIDPPSATPTWAPVKHSVLLDTVGQAMHAAGFHVRGVKIAVARDDHRLFATLDTSTGLNGGEITLAVAVVNSTDKSLPMKFIAGNRVFCCDNLALRSDLMAPVRRKHSRFGLERFREALSLAVSNLDHFRKAESARIVRFKATEISDLERDAVLLRSYERGIVSPRLLPLVIAESRKPSFDYGCPVNSAFVLEQAFTTVLGRTVVMSNPQRFCALSLSIQELLSESFGASELQLATPA